MQVVLRSEAKRLGLTRYFTGKQCKHGHMSERFSSGVCIECANIKNKAYKPKNLGGLDTQKICSLCSNSKPLSDFYKNNTGKFGVASKCKNCRAIYLSNWYVKNKDTVLKIAAKWAKDNAHKKRSYRAKRRAAILNATPYWADLNAIKNVYKQADALSKEYNDRYEVDHIIPLQGKNVSGLHVHWNLQIMHISENRCKGNRLWL